MPAADAAAFRAEFPVLDRIAYLNTGSVGPVPSRGAAAARERIDTELLEGRAGQSAWESLLDLTERLREGYTRMLGGDVDEVAVTRSTTDGCNAVIWALELGEGDEVLTSDEEHPGLLAPLNQARRRRGIEVRVVPFDEIASEIRPQTKLVACSHVSWASGRVADFEALAAAEPMVLLDGAQGLGAVPVDVRAFGCDFYAASGQKWLCGPNSSGCLWVRSERLAELSTPWPIFESVVDPERALESPMREDAHRFDSGVLASHSAAWSLAAIELFEEFGVGWMHERAASLADRLADSLRERGFDVVPRGRSTLVCWRDPDPPTTVERLAAQKLVVRHIPGAGVVRASVGAWTSEEELERLVEAVVR
ncbi:MAG: aminotransferase class V-fold PLP-dependent enzyme [Thermoleophilaceae bacterium]